VSTALITGASSGIGEATARRLDRDGWRLVLVARREDRLRALAAELESPATVIAADLTEQDAPSQIKQRLTQEHGGRLHLLVNNAGAAWRGTFAEEGWANVEKHMRLNFEAPVRLTEALLPLLRQTAAGQAGQAGQQRTPAIVNVASTAGRVSRPRSGAYSASKFALIGWSDALYGEEKEHGVHVGLVLPGFVRTEGFPAKELLSKPLTKRIVAQPDLIAEAIVQTGLHGKCERYAPRFYWLPAAARLLAPALVRRLTAGGALTTATAADD
jgi:short-subunit dehydrogenase